MRFDIFLRPAVRIYRHLGDISMVWSLEEIQDVEDLQLLSGHIHVLFGNLEKAQVGGFTHLIFPFFIF